jgi:hypothetical protein
MKMKASDCFGHSYADARSKFLIAADNAGLDVHSHPHPMLGRDGEALAMDVARFGAADATALLMLTSACHGIEGFAGSGVQVALLEDREFHRAAASAGVAVLYIHALNPYGFSWLRRATHENVDLNRNFHDFSAPLPSNERYDEIASLLVPTEWPPSPQVQARLEDVIERWGLRGLQQAIAGGQHGHPEGLFYGGLNPTWSHQTLRHVLREHGSRCARMGWIDLHTGLGPSGHGERIFACGEDDAPALARARAWWGKEVTAMHEGTSSATPLNGLMFQAAYDECPQAQYTGIALEYGTLPVREVVDALRAEQWLENHPEAPQAQQREIKQRMRDAFYVDDDDWRRRVVDQGREAAFQAVAGLSKG